MLLLNRLRIRSARRIRIEIERNLNKCYKLKKEESHQAKGIKLLQVKRQIG